MRKMRTAVSVLAVPALAVILTATGADATAGNGSSVKACSNRFCATSSVTGGSITIACGVSTSIPSSWRRSGGGGSWNNRLPGNGVVRMFDSGGGRIYTTPANYGPVSGNWTPVYSIRADC